MKRGGERCARRLYGGWKGNLPCCISNRHYSHKGKLMRPGRSSLRENLSGVLAKRKG